MFPLEPLPCIRRSTRLCAVRLTRQEDHPGSVPPHHYVRWRTFFTEGSTHSEARAASSPWIDWATHPQASMRANARAARPPGKQPCTTPMASKRLGVSLGAWVQPLALLRAHSARRASIQAKNHIFAYIKKPRQTGLAGFFVGLVAEATPRIRAFART